MDGMDGMDGRGLTVAVVASIQSSLIALICLALLSPCKSIFDELCQFYFRRFSDQITQSIIHHHRRQPFRCLLRPRPPRLAINIRSLATDCVIFIYNATSLGFHELISSALRIYTVDSLSVHFNSCTKWTRQIHDNRRSINADLSLSFCFWTLLTKNSKIPSIRRRVDIQTLPK
jgi:hypothetical protein